MMNFYVYAYMRCDGTPYYVGKGSGNRAYTKGNHKIGLPEDKTRIVILEAELEETIALEREKFYISHYGRKDLGTGILRNMTDGGDGSIGYIFTDEVRRKVSLGLKGKPKPKRTKEHSDNISKGRQGIVPWNKGLTFDFKKRKKYKGHSEESRKLRSEMVKEWHRKRKLAND